MNVILEVTNAVGIVAFAVAGATKAVEKRMDLLGALVLGFSSALAGGIIADVLLGRTPPTNLTYIPYPALALAASVLAFYFHKEIEKLRTPLLYADAVGLGAFSSSGASLAYSTSPNPLLVIMVGTLTAVGGGALRDILANEIPSVLVREFYAVDNSFR
ncbi:hypothetical protein HS1genome_1501 [Sulfodiicoccus acidiphilus]|uniref:Glycine transporter domain-containing protein n=1 Tax=Sulfodiicoccus acidiphilus TaxID=1670455 RepID=A0A348B4L0_9CREN|nr:trimeric intracellular cation channel family protein [Sulfodiicoccus acidiphilus]BBD73112.1 hypothetical protein HS1genome_1501 [Sulfodiicoccus acidiphilus]GGU00704.1 hypothetical protein GCM10007116_17450 [Sulfodiicoccus acidiphilus]